MTAAGQRAFVAAVPARYSVGWSRAKDRAQSDALAAVRRAIPAEREALARTALVEAAVTWAMTPGFHGSARMRARMDALLPWLVNMGPDQPVYPVMLAAQDVVMGADDAPGRMFDALRRLFGSRSDASAERFGLDFAVDDQGGEVIDDAP